MVTPILTVTIKELRELLHRPVLLLTLILGPLAVLIIFGIGSDALPRPPRAIIVVPEGQEQPRLVQEFQRQFNQMLDIAAYTDDEAYARAQLRRNVVDAVVILPPSPFETIAEGQPATIHVLYNEIDPLWGGLVPRFVSALAGEINREMFLQNAGEQRVVLTSAVADIDTVLRGLEQAIAATGEEDWQEAHDQVQEALVVSDRIVELLAVLGPQADPIRAQVERTRSRLQNVARLLDRLDRDEATPTADGGDEQIDLVQAQQSLQRLRDALTAYTTLPPEVVIAPVTVQTELVARFQPDFITFFAPTIVALLLQHVAVSLSALALVRERLAGTFDLFTIAPIAPVAILIGKYLAYLMFTMVIGMVLLLVLLFGLDVPLFGSPWRVLATVILVTLASVGVGLVFSLLATSERQAVQFSMLALLAVMFFSGFVLPLDNLRQPALSISYLMPATYGVVLLQDVMLRGLPGDRWFFGILSIMATVLFLICLALLHWRTRPH